MDDRQKENSTRGTAIAATVAALGLLFVVLIWGPEGSTMSRAIPGRGAPRDRRSRTMPRRRPCRADGNGRAQTLG